MIIYEYPFNELVRNMLRLEYLFDRFNHFARSDDPELHHNALTTLFELGDISARGDIKSLLLKELERQKFALNQLKHAKEVDQEKLASTMVELEHASAQVNASVIKPNALIGENEWLNAIRTRLHTPGGTSPIDLPSLGEFLKIASSFSKPTFPPPTTSVFNSSSFRNTGNNVFIFKR